LRKLIRLVEPGKEIKPRASEANKDGLGEIAGK